MRQIVKEVIEKVGESFHLLIRQIIKKKMSVNELKLFSSSHLYQKNKTNESGCIRRSQYTASIFFTYIITIQI